MCGFGKLEQACSATGSAGKVVATVLDRRAETNGDRRNASPGISTVDWCEPSCAVAKEKTLLSLPGK